MDLSEPLKDIPLPSPALHVLPIQPPGRIEPAAVIEGRG
jgi:hypothetical protein